MNQAELLQNDRLYLRLVWRGGYPLRGEVRRPHADSGEEAKITLLNQLVTMCRRKADEESETTGKLNMKREDQQDATIRCLLLTSVSTCFGHHYAHLQENKGPVTAPQPLPTTSSRTRTTHQMQCSHLARQRLTTATNYIQQNQNNTPNAVLTSCKTAPYNLYQPHPAEPEQHTKCSNRAFVLLKMGIMMSETC